LIDIHNHILPGVDDGAKTEEESLDMARSAIAEGIHTIIATPHHKNGHFNNGRNYIQLQVDILRQLLAEHDIPLTILPGQETRIYGDMVEGLKQGEILPLNETKYVHVEFPFREVPRYAEQLLYDMQMEGYVPIIVHPERNSELREQPKKLYDRVRKGSLTQVTAASLIGKFGKESQRFTHQLVDANLTHFIASDAHNTTTRRFYMADAYQELEQRFGNEAVYLFMENGQLLIENKNVNKIEPEPIKKKRFLGLF